MTVSTPEPQAAPTPTPPAPPAAKKSGPRLKVVGPSYCTAFEFPQEGSDTLVIDRTGTEVPAGDVESLIEQAAKYGVTLKEVSE